MLWVFVPDDVVYTVCLIVVPGQYHCTHQCSDHLISEPMGVSSYNTLPEQKYIQVVQSIRKLFSYHRTILTDNFLILTCHG